MDAAWVQYERLEKRLIHYFDYVPPIEAHHDVWSNELGEILILSGTSLNSFLAAGLYCDQFNEYEIACDMRLKLEDPNRDVNIGDLRKVYEKFYALSQQPVFLLKTEHSVVEKKGIVPHFLKLAPFAEWAPTRKKKGRKPEWWDVFTDLKHQRLKKIERATLKTVIDAVAGFFMVLAVHLGSIPTLTRFGVIHDEHGGKPMQHRIEWNLVTHRPRDDDGMVRKVPVDVDRKFCVAETPLFGYAYPAPPGKYERWLSRPYDFVGPTTQAGRYY